jgi:hypothetical protein
MNLPQRPDYNTFIPEFMRLLFAETDKVGLCSNVNEHWREDMYTMPQALTWLMSNQDTPNIYFMASSFGHGPDLKRYNCARASAIILDIDYGKVGHNNPTPFKTLDDTAGYLLTMPLQPSLAWHTGHGVQCAYLLDKPCVFPAAGGSDDAMARYMEACGKLKAVTMADACTPEHAYRVPLTLNHKVDKDGQALPIVMGSLLWYDIHRRYTLEQIIEAFEGYDIKDLIAAEEQPQAQPQQQSHGDYACIPQYIKDEIEGPAEDRSVSLFKVVGALVREGYDDAFIIDATSRGPDFREKYGKTQGGLRHQVEICISKIREGRHVYGGHASSPVRPYNEPAPVALNECQELPQDMVHMYRRYVEVAGIDLKPRVSDALKFHEDASVKYRQCVIESPCGAGKSVWALCHIASQAEQGRHVYVTETVDALHKAADMLEKLGTVGVGRLHGFNEDYCHRLSHRNYTWKQCLSGDPRSKCPNCEANQRCAYHTRDSQEGCQVLCMTHSGFIRALEDGSDLLNDAHVVIDESLSQFDTFNAEIKDLRRMAETLDIDEALLAQLFPQTSLMDWEQLGTFHRLDIALGSDTYASRNYVYRNENQTQAVADVVARLRTALARQGIGSGFRNRDWAKETLAAVVNFFRPSARGDSTYACHESEGRITCKRSRFSFGNGGPWAKLTMLNASASLSPFPYPDSMPVLTCPDIPGNSGLVTLHLVKANPTQTKQNDNVGIGKMAMFLGQRIRLHNKVLVCVNKDSEVTPAIESQVRGLLYSDNAEITVLTRGRIKGVNTAGDCTLALLQGMSLFTGLDDCALHAALHYRRTFPVTPYVLTPDGIPNWPGGRMLVPAMRNYYALRCLDEIYQAIWRTAVRNDRQVEAVIVIPDANWLTALYRTVMPLSVVASAYEAKEETIKVKQPDGTSIEYPADFVFDDQLYGIAGLCALPPGTEITKKDMAERLGYTGDDPNTTKKVKNAWAKNEAAIMDMLGDLFEPGSNVRYLRRKNATASV